MHENLPKTRKEAKSKNIPYYFTGIPCVNGHIDKRRTHNHTCNTCEKKVRKEIAKENLTSHVNKKRWKTAKRFYHPNQQPIWAKRKEIDKIYKTSRELEKSVDHIIPLKGKTKNGVQVCGLHCESNLQIISMAENHNKNMTVWPDMWNPRLQNPKYENLLKKYSNNIAGISYDHRYESYYVRLNNTYVGKSSDLFEAYCIRKSAEAKLVGIMKIEYMKEVNSSYYPL